MYPLLSKKRLLPCLATIRVVRKVDCGTYWVIDKSVALIITKQIVPPVCELLPDIEVGKSIACIASVVRPDKECAKPQFCRSGKPYVLDDYGVVYILNFLKRNEFEFFFDFAKPPIVFEAPGAAFLCVVKQRSQSYQCYAKLVQDETYVIEMFAVDENEKFSSLLYNNISISEFLNDVSETDLHHDEQRVLRGSLLNQWTNSDIGVMRSGSKNISTGVGLNSEFKHCIGSSSMQAMNKSECFKKALNNNVVGEQFKEKISLALAVAKLESKIEVQHAELSKKLDTLITARLMRSVRKTNEASTQTCIENIGGTCISRHSLPTTTCSSICEIEIENATDSYNETCSTGNRCWICGKSGSLTLYSAAEPSVFSWNDLTEASTSIDVCLF
uniref:DUF4708 domain-containing protein n=1 Tax=Syphacia muris TaxID=451379 RepID=A0A0N5B1G4_9BILA